MNKRKRDIRRIGTITVWVICLAAMLCVWPFCLIRKGAIISSNLATEYGYTESYIRHDMPYVQIFTPQSSKLEYIGVQFETSTDIEETDGVFHFTLEEMDGTVLYAQDKKFADRDGYFWEIRLNKWIPANRTLQYKIYVDEQYDDIFQGIYTLRQEDDAPGSEGLFIGDHKIEGQGIAVYGYGMPLNWKNIVCVWAFILLLTMTLVPNSLKTHNGRTCRISGIWDRLWTLLDKWQVPVLVLEIVGILLMIAYISRNRAVDWDEAYSVMMISKGSLREMIETTAADIHPPLYYLLLRLAARIFGDQFFVLKMVSAFFTGCTMFLGITAIRRHFGWRAAFLFHLGIGLGPQFIIYSVNIRMYSLALFFVTANAVIAYEILKEKKKYYWILFVCTGLGGAYTHYFAVVPMVFIYAYLMIGLIMEKREECRNFIIACAATVVGYLPWISVVITSFRRMGVSGEVSVLEIAFGQLAQWAFDTNMKWSAGMTVVLYLWAVVLLFRRNRHQNVSKHNFYFMILCAGNIWLTYIVNMIISSANNHFWDNRYVFAPLGLLVLFLCIMYSDQGKAVFCVCAVYLTMTVLSSYRIQMDKELGTNAYMDETYQTLEQVRDEPVVLYNYPTYDVLYAAHLRGKTFIEIDDFDWQKTDLDHIYLISWGQKWIPETIREKYIDHYVDCGTMQFEEGVAGVSLYKLILK